MAVIQKWGNSLAVCIPSAVAGMLQVSDGSVVELEVRDGELVLRPQRERPLSLKQ